ncbi:MAG: acetyl-CoA hydrolase/transferase C-terminal domain-containing protein [Terriglobia bacterium]
MQDTSAYRQKLMSAEEAVSLIQSGDRVYIHSGCAEPELLVKALLQRGQDLRDVEILHLMTLGNADYVVPEMEGHFRHNAFFIGSNVRDAINSARADYTPIFLSELSSLFVTGLLPIDVCLIQVSPPDPHGYCSFGVAVECTKTAAQVARTVIAEVNPQMPRVLGNAFIHLSKIDVLVEVDHPLLELPQHPVSPIQMQIGKHIAELIDDGSTLQTGIGGIPDSVLSFLGNHRELGIHSEMISDGIIPLIESGVITGERKTLHCGKVIASFVLGTRRLFQFIHNNPAIEFHTSEYVNDPYVVSQNSKMVAINAALQVDLTGQVCSDSMGNYFYSGIGGQLDFIRGAARSAGGKPIIALPSTAKGDTVSRIVPNLYPGAGVVTSRGDVHYVVTEYGVAYLHGKTIRERAEALIEIAHPKFREELYDFACQQNFLRPKRVTHAVEGLTS